MEPSLTDEQVIEQVLAGDREAFGVLVDRYEREMAAYAKYMTGSVDDAADIVQDSFVRAFKSLKRCRDRTRFKGWLFRIVSNQSKTQLKRRRRTEPLSIEALGVAASEGNPETESEQAELRRKVHEALQALPAVQREALVLKYVHGLGLPEMSELLSASVSALKMRLMRGREALRERLEEVAI